MEFVADILLAAGALGAGFYCFVLSRRLKRFNDLEKGVGGAVSVLSAQVEELTQSFETARAAALASEERLKSLTSDAESAAQRMELMIASLHDVDLDKPAPPEPTDPSATGAAGSELTPNPAPEPAPEKNDAPSGLMFMRRAHRPDGAAS